MFRFAFMGNPYRVIKLLVFVTGFCIVSCTTALAQQSLFVYLQSENQPFYVQIADRVYSSSPIGHLIISGLPDNTCNFEIGFPQHATQPQRFSIALRNKDHGYQLVKNGSRGWALHDLQTDETIKPLKEAGNSSLLYGERKKDDAFATLMAAVVNDSAVLYTSIVKKDGDAVPSVATKTDTKSSEKQLVVKTEEKPVQPIDTEVSVKKEEAVTVINPAPPVDTASQVYTGPIARDTALVTKYDPKEKGLNEKPEKPKDGVVKIQHQTKDGETKMVFVDSSETPAKVVTVYIADEKKPVEDKPVTPIQSPAQPPVDNNPVTAVMKTETKQEPVAKDSDRTVVAPPPVKQEVAATVKKEENITRETPKAPPTLTKEEIAEQIKKETWKPAAEKKASPTDTVTIIIESRQMKTGVSTTEEKSLYRPKPKQETQPALVKPTTPPDTTIIQIATPAKQDVEETPKTVAPKPVTEEKEVVKQEPVKPATEEKQVKSEPVKPVVTETPVPKANEPVAIKNDSKEEESTKEQVPKAVLDPKPAVVPEKKTEPVTQKDTATTVVKTDNQPAVVKTKPAEPEKPKTVEPEKKTETGNKVVMINSDCVKLATDNDVDKMRVKMLPETDLQKKLAVANKFFKTMCLYARQIKALSELFTTDESRYKFLELAYPFAADTANFKELHELLTDESYITKFKKLVRIQ
ncbi:MAG TPA: DUF4476 domain-containing protein [Niastella sp.]